MRRKILLVLTIVIVLLAAGLVGKQVLEQRQQPRDGATSLISLGDSVAAGDGLPLVPHASSEDAACYRSSQAYPEQLAKELRVPLRQYACSGAKLTTGLRQPQTTASRTVPAQLSRALPTIPGSDVVITIGPNDVGWSDLLIRCAKTDCTDAAPAQYQQSVEQLSANLGAVLQAIQAAHPRRVVVNQYYGIMNATDTCYSSYGITAAKISWVNAQEAALNAAIGAVAKQHAAQVVRLDFNGHKLCDGTSWVQGLLDLAPLHPNGAGQQQIATQDLHALLSNP